MIAFRAGRALIALGVGGALIALRVGRTLIALSVGRTLIALSVGLVASVLGGWIGPVLRALRARKVGIRRVSLTCGLPAVPPNMARV